MLAYVRLIRPRQMTKNLFCLAGVAFSGRFTHPDDVLLAFCAFATFSAMAGGVYILNDLQDLERDRLHPKKRYRPLAKGDVAPAVGWVIAILLLVGSLVVAWLLGAGVWTCLVLYLCNNIAYSVWLKHEPIIDVLSIAMGFVLRLLAGIYALPGELPTTWITLCTFFLTVFIGFAKRRGELAALKESDGNHQRPVLGLYTVQYLDYLVTGSAMMAVMCYALFTTSGKNATLVMTVPIVFYSLLHYQRTVTMLGRGEEPERLVFRDMRLLGSILAWLVTYFYVTLGNVHLFR